MIDKGRRCRPIVYAKSDSVAFNISNALEVLINPLTDAINLGEHNVIESVEIYTSVEIRTLRTVITNNSLLSRSVNTELSNRRGFDVGNRQEHSDK